MNILEGEYTDKEIDLKGIVKIPVTKEVKEAHKRFYENEIASCKAKIEEIKQLFEEEAKANPKAEPMDYEADPQVMSLREDIAYYQDTLSKDRHPILFGIRPEDVRELEVAVLVKNPSKKMELPLTIAELLGNEYYAHLDFGGTDLISKVNAEKELKAGEKISVIFNLDKCSLFDKRSGKNINPFIHK